MRDIAAHSSVYLPLACNFLWFESEHSFDQLEQFLKSTVVIFDRVVVQDGRLHLSAGEDGQGMCQSYPGNSFPGNRADIKPYTKGSPFGVSFNGQSLFASKAAFAVDVDYFPFLAKAGIAQAPYVEWSNHSLKPEMAAKIETVGQQLKHLVVTDDLQPYDRYFHAEVAERYAESAFLSYCLGMPLCLDQLTSRIAQLVSSCTHVKFTPSETNFVRRSIPMLNIPDFGCWTWDERLRFRESAAGADFRRLISGIGVQVREGIAAGMTDPELQRIADLKLGQALANELAARKATLRNLLLSQLLNLIPYGGLIGSGRDVTSTLTDHRSWISVIRKSSLEN